MKNRLWSGTAALLIALGLTGCESDGGLSARKQEKSAAYGTARTWQKNFIEKGVVANGFTPDLVYIAMGKPNRVETKELPEGRAEMWIYSNYYPNVDAVHGFQHARFSLESAYQPQPSGSVTLKEDAANNDVYANSLGAPTAPRGMDRGLSESLYKVGGPQGGTIEPAGLRSYTIKVLFAGDKVVRIGADENAN